jgi:hypothetical protein
MEAKNTESTSLAMFKMKGVSNAGNLTRHYFDVRSNGIVYINQFILSKEPTLFGFDAVYTKLGKTLHRTVIAFKFGTISGIYEALVNTLKENNVKDSDILI